MIQPLLYLVLFAPLLEPISQGSSASPGNPAGCSCPACWSSSACSALFVGFGIIAEIRFGTIERKRVTPASRLGLLLGRVLRDVLVLLVQATC